MRTLTRWILLVIMLVSPSISIAPLVTIDNAGQVTHASAQKNGVDDDQDDSEDDEDRARDKDEQKSEKDEDSPGRGRGDTSEIDETGGYTVETTCEFDDDDDLTECEFSGIAPDDASDIGRITVPADAICTDVLGGDFVFVDPDADARITGYASEEEDDEFTLEFDGEVTTTGTMTYWISTIGSVFPAQGPALQCSEGEGAMQDLSVTVPAPSPTTVPDITTGTVVVTTYGCRDVPADISAFDWFGQCVPQSDPLEFTVVLAEADPTNQRTTKTDMTGEAVFEMLAPGTYQLNGSDALWCHAESDHVDPEGGVIVQAGEQTTVWAFYCETEQK